MGSRLREARAIRSWEWPWRALRCGRTNLHPRPIPVVAQIPAKTYYVGQAIELRVGAEAAGERPQVDPPRDPQHRGRH